MYCLNKKGTADLLGTVILVLLGLSLIAIISLTIFNFIQQPTLSPEYSCPILQSKNILEIRSVCYNQETSNIETRIARTTDESIEIDSIQFILNDNIETTTQHCGNTCGGCKLMQPGNTRTYSLEGNEDQKTISLRFNNCILETRNIGICS